MYSELKNKINNSEFIIVGIGKIAQNENTAKAYNKLKELLQNKNYFIITLSNDDEIYKVGFEKDRIVAPCGTHMLLQCEDNCSNEVVAVEDFLEEFKNGKAKCQHCSKNLVFNLKEHEKYCETGYIKDWENYTLWLQKTLNKEIVMLELGVGLEYPSVIRWPFEKIAFFNLKSFLYRIHSTLFQIPEEIKVRCCKIEQDPIDFLLNEIV
ncbi:MAG: hypothetical protein ACRC7V_02025 [Lachnospiraceae bacterium]